MNTTLRKIFIAFIAGELFQIFLNFVAKWLYATPLWVCAIGGLISIAAVGLVGMVTLAEATPRQEQKSYREYAKERTTE